MPIRGTLGILLGCAVLAVLIAVGCNQSDPQRPARLSGGGSTFANPMMQNWFEAYKSQFGGELEYQSKGSATGITDFLELKLDFACTDYPLRAEQLNRANEVGGVVQIPILLTAVVPVYHLEGVTSPIRFSGPVLADVYLGRIRKWNDASLRALNPDIKLPDREITALHRADASATTAVFTSYLCRVSEDWRRAVGSGMIVSWPRGKGGLG